MKAKILHL